MNASQTQVELAANHAIVNAIQAIVDADRLAREAGYGSEVLSSMSQAIEALSYALNVVEGRV